MSTTALIVAAGSSSRMGFPKLTADLAGRPVLWHTLSVFDQCPGIDDLLVVVGPATREHVLTWAEDGKFTKPVQIVDGGAERHLSVHAGLQRLPETADLVAVHDGARPLVTQAQIVRCLGRARATGAAVSARPVSETLKRVDARGIISGSLDRTGAWVMETPQVFAVPLLVRAYEQIVRENVPVTDEVSAMQHAGLPVSVVENDTPNPKITWPGDLSLARLILLDREGAEGGVTPDPS